MKPLLASLLLNETAWFDLFILLVKLVGVMLLALVLLRTFYKAIITKGEEGILLRKAWRGFFYIATAIALISALFWLAHELALDEARRLGVE